jgi:hypothetical protein
MLNHTLILLSGFPDNFQLLKYNWAMDLSDIPEAKSYGIGYAIFFGFSAGLLGISGFETSANFVEEQKPGVFAKTLRNMWFIVSVYNPIIRSVCFDVLSLCVLPPHPTPMFVLDRWVGLSLYFRSSEATKWVGILTGNMFVLFWLSLKCQVMCELSGNVAV